MGPNWALAARPSWVWQDPFSVIHGDPLPARFRPFVHLERMDLKRLKLGFQLIA